MTSRNLRKERIPANGIIMSEVNNLNSGFTHPTTFNDRYVKHIPACGTPGNTVGSSTHTHASQGNHLHTACGSAAHTHTASSGGPTGGTSSCKANYGSLFPSNGHTHAITLTSTTPSVTISTSCAHTHDAQCNDPSFRTLKHIKKDTSVNMRQNQIPVCGVIIWSTSLCNIPNCFSINTNTFNRINKATLNACTSPGTNCGRDTHTHSNVNHNHNICLASHSTHGISVGNAGNGVLLDPCVFSATYPTPSHGHGVGSAAEGANSDSNTLSCLGHTHGAENILPKRITAGFITRNTVNLRKEGIPPKGTIIWECSLCCIPNCFNAHDGTNCTADYRDRYLIGIPDACTNPGTTSGCHTHTHTANSHCHAGVSLAHTHTMSGALATTGGTGAGANAAGAGAYINGHAHGTTSSSSNSGPTVGGSCGDSHTHGSIDTKPSSIEVAYIQRL